MEKVKKDLSKVTILKAFEQFEEGQEIHLPLTTAKDLVKDGFAAFTDAEAPKPKAKQKAPKK
jgi:hypothetical protein